MNALNNLLAVAKKLEQKLFIKAQVSSAQAGDIENALKQAGLWELSNQVSPMLNTAGVPDNVKVQIDLMVDRNLNVKFMVSTVPPHGSALRLAALLQGRPTDNASLANKMRNALRAAKLSVADTLKVSWLNF